MSNFSISEKAALVHHFSSFGDNDYCLRCRELMEQVDPSGKYVSLYDATYPFQTKWCPICDDPDASQQGLRVVRILVARALEPLLNKLYEGFDTEEEFIARLKLIFPEVA